jgi:hypothetical protein
MRAAAYYTAGAQDLAHHSSDEAENAAASRRVALLTPVIKTWLTETAQELTSLAVQVQGGMGFVEETGAAQHMRDARILPIYEGTTGIQALDFVGRKIMGDEGRAMDEWIAEMAALDSELAVDERLAEIRKALATGTQQHESAKTWLLQNGPLDPNTAGSASVNMLMLAGIVLGGWQMARAGLAIVNGAASDDASFAESKLLTVRFYAQHIMPKSHGLLDAAIAGPEAVMAFAEEQF